MGTTLDKVVFISNYLFVGGVPSAFETIASILTNAPLQFNVFVAITLPAGNVEKYLFKT